MIWAGNTINTKAAWGAISPGSIAFYRWILAFLVLLPLVGSSAWRERRLALRYWKQLATLGVLGMVVYQTLAYYAAATTTAINMGVILSLLPLISMLLATVFVGERMTSMRALGGILSLGGLVYLTSAGAPARLIHGGFHIGDGLMLLGVVAQALYGVLLKRWAIPISLWHQIFWQVLLAIILLFPIWMVGTASPITTTNFPLIVYAAVPASLFAPVLWMMGIRDLGAGRTALLTNLLPLVVALLAWWMLGETLHLYHLIGGAVALVGVSLGLGAPRKRVGREPLAVQLLYPKAPEL